MMSNGGKLADRQITLKPDASVVGYEVGQTIVLTECDFLRWVWRGSTFSCLRYGYPVVAACES